MSRKDYELIARIIDELPTGDEVDRLIIAKEFAWALAHENPRFDRERFLKACGVEVANV